MEKTVAASVELITAPIGCKSVILASAKQTKHQEEEQNRNSELPGKLVEEYANDDNSREYQKVQCHKFITVRSVFLPCLHQVR